MSNFFKYRPASSFSDLYSGLPGNHPIECMECGQNETVASPWLKVSRDELDSIVASNANAVEQWNQAARSARLRGELKDRIRSRAYELEVAGMTLNDTAVDTSRESQAMLSGAVNFLALNPEAIIDWQRADGTFAQLGKAEIEALALAVGTHVQAHFSRRRALSGQLDQTEDGGLEAFRLVVEKFWE